MSNTLYQSLVIKSSSLLKKIKAEGPQNLLKISGFYIRLLMMDWRLRFFPHAWNRSVLFPAKNCPVKEPPLASHAEIRSLERLCNAAAARLYFRESACLRRALVLRAVLRRHGYQFQLVYGVARKNKTGAYTAHAWLAAGTFILDGNTRQGVAEHYSTFSADL